MRLKSIDLDPARKVLISAGQFCVFALLAVFIRGLLRIFHSFQHELKTMLKTRCAFQLRYLIKIIIMKHEVEFSYLLSPPAMI